MGDANTPRPQLSPVDPGEQPPASPPSAASIAHQAEWRSMQGQSLRAIRASAEGWRGGLGALVAVITGGLVVSGPDNVSNLAHPWKYFVAGTLILGVLLLVIGLYQTIGVAAGKSSTLTFNEFLAAGGRRDNIDSSAAFTDSRTLHAARMLAAAGMVLMLLAICAWLVAPARTSPRIEITTKTEILCGKLDSGDKGVFVVTVEGEKDPAMVNVEDIQNAAVKVGCEIPRAAR